MLALQLFYGADDLPSPESVILGTELDDYKTALTSQDKIDLYLKHVYEKADKASVSTDGDSFIRECLQHAAFRRPSATFALRHGWFREPKEVRQQLDAWDKENRDSWKDTKAAISTIQPLSSVPNA